jgi:gliding motility-associated lipoprotein GldD
MRNIEKLIALLPFVFAACTSDPVPKPVGYFRIDLPRDTFKAHMTECPYQFDIHQMTIAKKRDMPCWINFHYPQVKAMLQITYRPVENNIDTLLNDVHNLVFRHTVKADGIQEKLFLNEEKRVYGTLYRLHGDAATHTQFFLTDSVNHFLRGVVYFNAVPNEDSLRPVNEYMYAQILHLIETTEWKKSEVEF